MTNGKCIQHTVKAIYMSAIIIVINSFCFVLFHCLMACGVIGKTGIE